jgi:hypothetical protein
MSGGEEESAAETEVLLREAPPFPALEVLQLGANSLVSVLNLRLGVLARTLKAGRCRLKPAETRAETELVS